MVDKTAAARLLEEMFPQKPKEPTFGERVLSGQAPQQAEMRPYNPTLREQTATLLQRGMERLGADRYKALQRAETLVGGPGSNLPLGMGFADILPFVGTTFQTQEAGRSLESAGQAAKRGDYVGAAVEGGLGALGLVPGALAVSRYARPVGNLTASALAAAPKVPGALLEAAFSGPLPGSREAQRGAIKMKGGNWLANEVEGVTEPLRQKTPGGYMDAGEALAEMRRVYPPETTNPDLLRRQEPMMRTLEASAALNNWIDKKLNRYIRNEMATPEDPVRKLAEQGILHYEPQADAFLRSEARDRRTGEGNQLGVTPLAKAWEDNSDLFIIPSRAEDFQSYSPLGGVKSNNPWLDKVPPETKVYEAASTGIDNLGFEHLIDELKNSIRPDSDLPAHLRWKPEDLEKVTMEQAVRRVHDINQYRAQKKAEANEVLARNPATATFKEYPTVPGTDLPNERGLAWKEIKPPEMSVELPQGWSEPVQKGNALQSKSVDGGIALGADLPDLIKNIYKRHPETPGNPRTALEEALKYEGDVMGHCVGGYCDDVLSGRSKIYSLRDSKGEPRVTIEVRQNLNFLKPLDFAESAPPSLRKRIDEADAVKRVNTQAEYEELVRNSPEYQEYLSRTSPEEIVQIKGSGKKDSSQRLRIKETGYKDEPDAYLLPFVQDFVRNGNWARVGDIQNTGLITPDRVLSSETRRRLEAQGVQIPKYMTEQEAKELSKQAIRASDIPTLDQSAGGMKKGGAVKKVRISDNPDTMNLELMMAGGGSPRQKLARAITSGVKSITKPAEGKSVLESLPQAPKAARTPEEESVLGKFGQKQEQEAARAKKVEKQAQSDEPKREVKSKGKREKVEADFYRKMEEELGPEAVMKAALAGEHLKPTPSGYVGAPRTVTSPQALGAMRKAMDKDFADSVEALRLADESRLGTWYDRAKQGIAESAEPYQLPRVLEQHGVYSAGVSPESELGFALKHLNSRVAGEPGMAYRGAPMRTLDEAVAAGEPVEMGFKIGEYAKKNDPRIPNTGLFGVNDFRRAQGMGYTDPTGAPWRAGVSETMHPFMDAETALQVERANRANLGGRSDWQGPHIQEVPWVYGKAQDLYSRGKTGRFAGDELEGIKSALAEANNTARDYMYKHAASATHEAVPGASLGHVPKVLEMSPAEKLEYGRTGRWDLPAPEAVLSEYPQVGAGNRDIIYGAAGYRQLPSREAEGLYINRLGGVETNPMTIARPLMDFPTGGGGLMSPESRKMADALEQFRAFIDAQEAGAYNLPNTMASVKGKNSLVLDSRSLNPNKLNDPSAGVIPTAEQLADMNKVMEGTGFGVSATNRGVTVFPFDPMMDPKEAAKILRKKQKELTDIYPSTPEKSLTTTGYVPGIGKRSPEGPVPTAPYTGEATSDLLQAFAELHPSVAKNISESEAIRAAIRQKALRDAKLGGARGDIQESRRFFSEADWPKAVEMIRKGMSAAAALSALGYSATSMAKEGE